MITERDIQIVLAVARYYVLNRQLIQRLFFPDDSKGRVTRRRIQMLVDAGLISRQQTLICQPSTSTAAPVYFPSRHGCELLAEYFDDQRFFAISTRAPIAHHVLHWLAGSETHIAFDEAIAQVEDAQIESWVNEYDLVNVDEALPQNRYRLYTLISEQPRLICAPDAGFLLSMKGHSKVFYLEQDRNTSGVQQVAHGKCKGYAALAQGNLHLRHFQPTVEGFTVLMVTTTERRREALRKAFEDKPRADLWRFATAADLTGNFLYTPIWRRTQGEPGSILKR